LPGRDGRWTRRCGRKRRIVYAQEHELVLGQMSLETQKRLRVWAGGDAIVVARRVAVAGAGEADAAALNDVWVNAIMLVLQLIRNVQPRSPETVGHFIRDLPAQVRMVEHVRMIAHLTPCRGAVEVMQLPDSRRMAAFLRGTSHVEDGAALALWKR